MLQSFLNSQCLLASQFCFCYSLKAGTIVVAFGGLLMSTFLVFLYGFGKPILEGNGVNPETTDIVLHVYAILGILLFASSIMLFIAAMTYNEKLILLYLWYIIVYFVIDSIAMCVVSILAFLNNAIMFGFMVVIIDSVYWALLYYYVLPVVNGFRTNIHTVVIYIE